MVNLIIRLEGFVILFVSLYFYATLSGNWMSFFLFLLVPDISMVGYFKDKKLGAFIYNLVHNYLLALLLIVGGLITENAILLDGGLILSSHIGLDRLLGYGLKYPTDFKHTHMQKV